MANYKNTVFYKVDDEKVVVPASSNKTGTISTKGRGVIGVGTKFTEEMQTGSWIVDLTNNEVRKVITVDSDTVAYLDKPFTTDISALTTPNVVSSVDLNIREISIAIPLVDSSGTAYGFGEIDGVVLESGLPVSYGKNSDTKENSKSFIDPIIVNATGTVANVTILR